MSPHKIPRAPGTALPPLNVLQDALRKTTETLARELAAPSTQTPRWNELEWQIAEAAAVMQGISALLAHRLRWNGPDRWRQFLDEQRRQTQLRHERIAGLLHHLDQAARDAGLPLLALKGAALYRMGVYPRHERPMGDVDLLARPADLDAACRVVASAGYAPARLTARHQLFEPLQQRKVVGFGEHAEHPINIDLHARIAERLPVATVDITQLEFPQGAQPGLNEYPSPAALMRHLLLHAANNARARALRFIQLHDVAVLASRFRGEDWEELRYGAGANGLWWAFVPLALTNRYFPSSVPPALLEAASSQCPRLLRRCGLRHTLTDVSWSRLTIQAFPGIEWCRTPWQILVFARQRLMPTRKDTEGLRTITVKRPYGASVPWYGLSHINRIARWVFASPPRVQAIYPIRIALGLQRP
jgi:hypothetical protein